MTPFLGPQPWEAPLRCVRDSAQRQTAQNRIQARNGVRGDRNAAATRPLAGVPGTVARSDNPLPLSPLGGHLLRSTADFAPTNVTRWRSMRPTAASVPPFRTWCYGNSWRLKPRWRCARRGPNSCRSTALVAGMQSGFRFSYPLRLPDTS